MCTFIHFYFIISFNVFPFTSFHAINPLVSPPVKHAAAADGLLNKMSLVSTPFFILPESNIFFLFFFTESPQDGQFFSAIEDAL
jgi:hypothetical protein